MSPLGLILGTFVGFSLGLTGGGGAIFAVPLLVYGLATDPRQAVRVQHQAIGAACTLALMDLLPITFPYGGIFVNVGKMSQNVSNQLLDCTISTRIGCVGGRIDRFDRALPGDVRDIVRRGPVRLDRLFTGCRYDGSPLL